MKHDVILIAGLGPAHLENSDLKNSYLDQALSMDERKSSYMIGTMDYSPDEFVYCSANNEKVQVLRKVENQTPELIVVVLRNLLDVGNIDYEFISIDNLWKNEVIEASSRIVCLSTTFMWSEHMIDFAINWIKENIKFEYLVLGGQYSFLKREYLLNKHKCIDFLITGDAEISLVPLLKSILDDTRDYCSIPNLIYKENYIIKETEYVEGDINQYSTPVYEGQHSVIPYISMKGCIYNCKFCALSYCSRKWQYRTANNIINDWDLFVKRNEVKHIDINDSTFFIPYKRVKELLPKLVDMNITWEANARADTPFEEDIRMLESSGCKALFFGFESMSDVTLNNINKKTTSDLNRKINKMFSKTEIYTMMSFIIGFPGENHEEFNKTRNYLINEHYGHFNIYVFEFEDKCMPIWEDKEKFQIEIYEDEENQDIWNHGGLNWKHNGMDSKEANRLREKLLSDIRKCQSTKAIHKSWQYAYEWPLIKERTREENICIEKIFDQLMFLKTDYIDDIEREKMLKKLITKLKTYGIATKNS